MKDRKKSLYHFRGFTGIDVSIAISLFEYGLAWKKIRKDEYIFVVGISSGETDSETTREIHFNRFAFFNMSREDFRQLCREKWFELDSVASTSGISKEDFIYYFPMTAYDAVLYHDYENIFGSSYGLSFQIKE